MRVLVTGANGFLGSALIRCLASGGHQVVAAARSVGSHLQGVTWVKIGDLNQSFDWHPIAKNVDAVVHLAGVAHRPCSDDEMIRVNVESTSALLKAAKQAGIGRFIFISSIGAQTGSSSPHVITEDDAPRPTTMYGKSKLLAETEVRQSGLNFTILRPVIVEDDADPKGNVKLLYSLASLPIPLPIGSITARRSTLPLDYFCAAVQHTLDSPATIGKTYIVADTKPRTISEMVSQIRLKQNRAANIFPLNTSLLSLIMRMIGKRDLWEKIAHPLVADPSKLISDGWEPTAPKLMRPE